MPGFYGCGHFFTGMELRPRKIRVSLEMSPVDREGYREKNNVGRNRAFLLPFPCLISRKSIVIKGVRGYN
jgi:hypothetical protein